MKKTYFWLPNLFFAEGLPAAIIAEVSVPLLLAFGLNNTEVAFLSSLLGFAPLLLVKLLCAPAVDALYTRRHWIIATQGLLAALLLIMALACLLPSGLAVLTGMLFAAALVSGIHDIAADGFYILGLSEKEQAVYSGLRSVFYRVALVAGSGGLVMLAGFLSGRTAAGQAWSLTLGCGAVIMVFLAVFSLIFLPAPESDKAKPLSLKLFFQDFADTFISFFRKKHVVPALLFLLLYRFAEAQLGTMSKLFLIDHAGMALTLEEYGFYMGTLGICMMLTGGVLAGFLIAKLGLGRMFWISALALNVPDLVYVLLAFMPDAPSVLTGTCIAVEQFGYGFGFAAYMLFMVWFAATGDDDKKTSHFALMTIFMIAGIRLPGMWAGWLAEKLPEWLPCALTDYQLFFIWVIVCTIPGFAVTYLAKKIAEPGYGLSEKT